MLGRRPYTGANRTEIRNKILNNQVQVKKHEIPEGWSLESADFINRLIQRKPINRLGSNGAIELKSHDWLKNFNWLKLSKKRIEAHKIYKTNDIDIRINVDDDDPFSEFQTLAKNENEREFIQEKGYLLSDDSVQNLFSNFEIDRDEYYAERDNLQAQKDEILSEEELKSQLNLMLLE